MFLVRKACRNIFGLILKNKMAAISISLLKNAFFSHSSTSRNFQVRLFKFTGYVYYQKTLPGNIFRLISKNKMTAIAISFLTLQFLHFCVFFSSVKDSQDMIYYGLVLHSKPLGPIISELQALYTVNTEIAVAAILFFEISRKLLPGKVL